MKKLLVIIFSLFIASFSWATVNITDTKVQYSCNGSTTTYAYSFQIYEDDDLIVTKTGSDSVETTLVLNTDYTVTGAGGLGGTVELTAGATCGSGNTITITRAIELLQELDLEDGQAFSAEDIETAFDKAMLIAQDQGEDIGRALKLPISSEITDLTMADGEADKLLGWNSTGDQIVNVENFTTDITIDISTGDAGKNVVVNSSEDGFEVSGVDTFVDHKADFSHIVYQDVAEIRASTLTPFDGQKISMLGTGGDWFWDASATGADNTGTRLKVATITTGRWKRIYNGAINALWFGSPADGIIQDAMDVGESEVFLPDIGIDYIADVLDIPDTLRVLRGVGFPTLISSAAGIRTIDYTGTAGTDGLLITGITFKGHPGGSESSTNESINILTLDNLRIIDNRFENTWVRAMELTNVDYFEVSRNLFKNCSNGPYFIGCGYGKINKNIIRGSQQADATFKVGIALMPFDATYGLNHDINISDNVISDLQDSQGILAHAGEGIIVAGNNITDCAQGINFNRDGAGDNFLECSILGNRLRGVGSAAAYTPTSDVGITVSGTSSTVRSVLVENNTVRFFNLKELNDNLGGISLISANRVTVQGNTINNCGNNGVVFSGADSASVLVQNNDINNIDGGTAHGGIKVDSPTIVSGLFKNNWITSCDKAYRLETAALPDLIVESDTEKNNTAVSTGKTACIFNGNLTLTGNDTSPSVRAAVKSITFSNTGATLVDTFDDTFDGQQISMKATNTNTTLSENSGSGGNFRLSVDSDYNFSSIYVTLGIRSDGTNMLETSRSAN